MFRLLVLLYFLLFSLIGEASDLYFKNDILDLKRNYDVNVKYKYSPYNFPTRWLKSPISAKGEQLSNPEISRTLLMIDVFLRSYSKECIKENLKNIVLLKKLSFYGKSFGGTNSRDSLYIKNDGEKKGFTDIYLLGIMHAEFSSILMRKNSFPKIKWASINRKDFKYVGNGVMVLGQKGLNSNNEQLLKDGFLAKYAQSSLENDFNIFSTWMFTKPKMLKLYSDKYPKIRKKMDLTLGFYESVCNLNR